MRLSVSPRDRGFRPNKELARYRIFFNGEERFDVFTADEEEGWIRTVKYERPAPWLGVRTILGPVLHGTVQIVAK